MRKIKLINNSKCVIARSQRRQSNLKTGLLRSLRSLAMTDLKFLILGLSFAFFVLHFTLFSSAQQNSELEFNLDINSPTIPLPGIFKPNIDLSGRGFSRSNAWPQGLASAEVLEIWEKEIGFKGIYRIQYNLWEINEQAKDDVGRQKLLANYEELFKKISDAGGTIILDLFATPAGLGKILDKKSPPLDLKAFKELVKGYVRNLSCDKKFNIWYEVWSAPDLDDFFLGRRQDYLALYRAAASAIKELEDENKIHIPVGGPAVSWWFQDCEGNTIITPEKSLIYELIRYCYHYRLPLDFISWHTYSTDPKPEQELTRYKKTSVSLVRDWLSYFGFDKETLLIIDEWNYDSGANYLPARADNANIASSFILSRMRNMYESGIDRQLYFALEDFNNNQEHVVRNVGAFLFDGQPKSIFNVFKILSRLGKDFYAQAKIEDEFSGVIASKDGDTPVLLFYNYIDPYAARNYLSRNIALLADSERAFLLKAIKNEELNKLISAEKDISKVRTTRRLKSMLKKAQELNRVALAHKTTARTININLKNLKENYLCQRFTVDASCAVNCKYAFVEEKEIPVTDNYKYTLKMDPYSVTALIFTKKPKVEEIVSAEQQTIAQSAAAQDETGKVEEKVEQTAE